MISSIQYYTRAHNIHVLDYCFCCKKGDQYNGTTKYINFNMKHLQLVPNDSTFMLFSLKASYTVQIPQFFVYNGRTARCSPLAECMVFQSHHGEDEFFLPMLHTSVQQNNLYRVY